MRSSPPSRRIVRIASSGADPLRALAFTRRSARRFPVSEVALKQPLRSQRDGTGKPAWPAQDYPCTLPRRVRASGERIRHHGRRLDRQRGPDPSSVIPPGAWHRAHSACCLRAQDEPGSLRSRWALPARWQESGARARSKGAWQGRGFVGSDAGSLDSGGNGPSGAGTGRMGARLGVGTDPVAGRRGTVAVPPRVPSHRPPSAECRPPSPIRGERRR